jgi:hypothetical protein
MVIRRSARRSGDSTGTVVSSAWIRSALITCTPTASTSGRNNAAL